VDWISGLGAGIIGSGATAAQSVIPTPYIASSSTNRAQASPMQANPLTAYDKVGVVASGLGVARSSVNPFVATAGNTPTTGVNYGTYLNAQGQGMSGRIPAGSTNYTSILTPAQVQAGRTTAAITSMPSTPAVVAARRILMNNGRL